MKNMTNTKIRWLKNGWFNGNEYQGVRFTAVATVGKSTKWSELGDIQALEVLLNKGLLVLKYLLKHIQIVH